MAAANKGKKRVTFSLSGNASSEVYLAGSFNDWNAEIKKLKYDEEADVHVVIMMLPAGSYEYKFVVDGVWSIDPNNPSWQLNELGTMNSVVRA